MYYFDAGNTTIISEASSMSGEKIQMLGVWESPPTAVLAPPDGRLISYIMLTRGCLASRCTVHYGVLTVHSTLHSMGYIF